MSIERQRAGKHTRVLLDSNALFVPLQFRIDIFEGLKTLLSVNAEPVVLSPVLKELRTLAKEGSEKTRKEASFALTLAEKCRLIDYDGESADDTLVDAASEWRCPVFTNDMALRKRLRDINVPVIYVRQKSRLEIDGGYNSCLNS
jgi:rRNA-processing protein FCF1